MISLSAIFALSGCLVKKVIKVSTLPEGKVVETDELIKAIQRYQQITSLTCKNFELSYTSAKKKEAGILEKYRGLRGYILLKRPESVLLNLQVPVVKTTLFKLISVGDSFSLHYPRDNKFYLGKNSIKELVVDKFSFPIRGSHIFEAIFPQAIKLDSPGIWISNEEQSDALARYYVLSIFRQGAPPAMHILRRIWIERMGLTITRQQVFSEDGKVVSDISYSKKTIVDRFSLPRNIHIDRPLDGYVLDLEFNNWEMNSPNLTDDVFEMASPPGVRVIDIEDSADKQK
jgi:hypothetical protein